MFHPYDAIAAMLSSLRKVTFGSLSWLGVGLEISRSLVQFPAGALWSVLGQDSLLHIASGHPADESVCAISCQLHCNIPLGIEVVSVRTAPAKFKEGRVNISVDTRL